MAEDPVTIWDRLALCVAQLDEPLRASEIVGWFRRHYPGVNEASLRAHIQSATSNVDARSKIHGMARRRPLITRIGHGLYIRYPAEGATPPEPEVAAAGGAAGDLILLACSERKADTACRVRDLYLGEAFRRGVGYAEARVARWYVLSGKWGLLHPDDVIAPYDLYLANQPQTYRVAWGQWVAAQLQQTVGGLRGLGIEMLAPAAYVDPLRNPLEQLGATILEPLRGLRQGEQLAWYGTPGSPAEPRASQQPPPAPQPPSEPPPATPSRQRIRSGPVPGGPFEYRWPTSSERFDTSWLLSTEHGGKVYQVRHCLGSRHVYGRERRHSVTFVNGVPEVEGVAADDYDRSRALVSPLKAADRKLVRRRADVPPPYAGFPLVDHLTEVTARYSRDAIAVKLAEDDAAGWAGYALARIDVRQAEVGKAPRSVSPAAGTPSGVHAERTAGTPSTAADTAADTSAIVQALLELGRSGLDAEWVGPSSFTPDAAANQLVVDDPFAFLLGVLFDQGIPAERAWEAPFRLKQRLGHLNPERMAVDEVGVRRAIDTEPKLHRFVEKMPAWVVAAARIVTHRYGGEAGAIWAGDPTARELQDRLTVFPGIGQKKAAMAVEILERDLGVPVRQMHGSDVAYDVHVRRVFLRTHLAQYDDLDHMVRVARDANPSRPGEIDLPAWHVGRTWCRAGRPLCDQCPLGQVCPRDVEAASNVRGV